MWQQLVDTGLPIPSSVTVQGRLPSGHLQPRDQLLVEYLEVAHRLSRNALSRWPTRNATQVRWQHLELPGGREDPVATARYGARYPGISSGRRRLPGRSARRVGANPAWTCRAIARAALRSSRLLVESEWLGDVKKGAWSCGPSSTWPLEPWEIPTVLTLPSPAGPCKRGNCLKLFSHLVRSRLPRPTSVLRVAALFCVAPLRSLDRL